MSRPDTSWLDALSFMHGGISVAAACDSAKMGIETPEQRAEILRACEEVIESTEDEPHTITLQRIVRLKDWACS